MYITCCETPIPYIKYIPSHFGKKMRRSTHLTFHVPKITFLPITFTPLSNSCVGIKVKAYILLSIPYLFLFSLFPNIRKVFSFLSLPLPSTVAKHSLREPLKRECQNSKLFCEKKQKTKKTKSR